MTPSPIIAAVHAFAEEVAKDVDNLMYPAGNFPIRQWNDAISKAVNMIRTRAAQFTPAPLLDHARNETNRHALYAREGVTDGWECPCGKQGVGWIAGQGHIAKFTPALGEEDAPNFKAIADEIGEIVHHHIAPMKGFTFHPVYIRTEAYDPMIAVLTRVYELGRSRTPTAGTAGEHDEYCEDRPI